MVDISVIKFDAQGLCPAIAQDQGTGEVLMLAYMNKEALTRTLETKKAHYYSRSREKLWLKGETSGNIQDVLAVYYDCDADAILLSVESRGPACHTGERTCFFRAIDEFEKKAEGPAIIKSVFEVIKKRKAAPPDESYVASLYAKGVPKILEKIKEESGELIEAATDKENKEVVHELTDLLFHCLVLLSKKDIEVDEVFKELKKRFGTSGIAEKNARPDKGKKG